MVEESLRRTLAAFFPTDGAGITKQPSDDGGLQRAAEKAALGLTLGLDELREKAQINELRGLVREDPTALQHFLDVLSAANPELLRRIAVEPETFLHILLEERAAVSEGSRDGASPSPNVDVSAKQGLTEIPSTHLLAQLFNPYTCAVCKGTDNLLLCSCKSARYCCREHQREFWPRHRSVCQFLTVSKNLLLEVHGLSWLEDALPRITEVWTKEKGRPPASAETEQLARLPRCRVCKSLPAHFPAENHFQGYCSEECEAGDVAWRRSWQSKQLRSTALVSMALHRGNGALVPDIRRPDLPLQSNVFDKGWPEYVLAADLAAEGIRFAALPTLAQQVLVDQMSYPLIVLEALFRAERALDDLCQGTDHLEVHVLGADGTVVADVMKYEEWMHRAGGGLRSLEIWFVGQTLPDVTHMDVTHTMCQSCLARSCRMTIRMVNSGVSQWLRELAPSREPTVRVSYRPVLGNPVTRAEWSWAFQHLADAADGVPLVLSESRWSDLKVDEVWAGEAGLTTRVAPSLSKFPSALAVPDDVSLKADPVGLFVWNMCFAVFDSPGS